MNVIDVVNRALLDHQPKVDHHYEETECSCGWREPDLRPRPGSGTYAGPRDGASDWPDHQRRAVRAALKKALR